MQKTKLYELLEEADLIINELNNLDYRKQEEDPMFCENLKRLDNLHCELNGTVNIVKPKTSKYLQ